MRYYGNFPLPFKLLLQLLEPLFASLSLIQNDWNCINVSIQIAPIKKQKEKKGYAMNQSFKKPR